MESNWCIRLTDENRDIVVGYFEKQYVANYKGVIGHYYGHYNGDCFRNGEPFGKEIITHEFIEKIKLEGYNVDYRESINKYYIVTNGYKSEILETSKNNPPINKFLAELDKDTQNVFDKTLSSLADLLKYKNTKYGNSVLDPLEIFKGKCKAGDRIDDKLSRIKTSKELRKNDVSDLIGYLVLTCVENNWDNFDEFKD